MPRIRTIKPEFWTSEDVVGLSPMARLLFPALWCEADRGGRMEWRPGSLKLRYFPADEVNIESLADEMEARGMLLRYEIAGKRYAVLPNFAKHQVINNREQASQIPDPPSEPRDASPTRENSDRTRADASTTRDDASPTREHATATPLAGREGRKEGNTRGAKSALVPLPDNFAVSDRVRAWAKQKGFDRLEERLEAFSGKARAKGYKYANWDEAFMGAIRDGWAAPAGGSGTSPSRSGTAGLPY